MLPTCSLRGVPSLPGDADEIHHPMGNLLKHLAYNSHLQDTFSLQSDLPKYFMEINSDHN